MLKKVIKRGSKSDSASLSLEPLRSSDQEELKMSTSMTVDALAKELKKLSTNFYKGDKSKYEDYIGLEQLSEAFFNLNLPKSSDILNPFAGPGLLSLKLQTKGYFRIDGLDEDMETVKSLRESGLYANCMKAKLAPLYASGLRDDIYDAVVMVGCPQDSFLPHVIDELMRITKPDGHLLFTMRSDLHTRTTNAGVLDENLLDLERRDKCIVLKMGEQFVDSHSGKEGLLYVIKRIDIEDFDPKGVPRSINDLVTKSIGTESNNGEGCNGHNKLCQAFFKCRLPRDIEILDLSQRLTSPGIVGVELGVNGYNNVDAVQSELQVLNAARAKNAYRNYIVGRPAALGSLPIKNESYDVLVMAGGFAPGELSPACFPELLRVLRPGGYLFWTMADVMSEPDFALFDVKLADLVSQREVELIVGPVFFEKFDNKGQNGRFYMVRKCHREVFALGSPKMSRKARQ